MPETAFAFIVNSPASEIETINQDDFDKKFREGRDLIDKEDWAQAALKFGELIEKYPDHKSTDAALYWLAFCHKKQFRLKEADAALDRLMEKFPASSWVTDARVMKFEIAAPLGRVYSSNVPSSLPGATSIVSPADVVKGVPVTTLPEYNKIPENGGIYTNRVPLDREDEIKIAAFQSLLAADTKRAIETMGEILRTDSKASETLKQEVLRVLRNPFSSRNQTMTYTAATGNASIGKEFVPLLRETLVKSFQNEENLKIRKEIIYTLANLSDRQSADYLKKLYVSENDREIKKAIINSFGGTANFFYGFNSNVPPIRKIESDFLFEIVQSEKDVELRRLAFSNVQRFPGWAVNEQTVETLARIYDAEADEAFKISIIRAFSGLKQNRATAKLLDIAKNDKSDKLRLEAIYSLRTSKDPAVLKFLEELIK
jgi:HEAT repeat protein